MPPYPAYTPNAISLRGMQEMEMDSSDSSTVARKRSREPPTRSINRREQQHEFWLHLPHPPQVRMLIEMILAVMPTCTFEVVKDVNGFEGLIIEALDDKKVLPLQPLALTPPSPLPLNFPGVHRQCSTEM